MNFKEKLSAWADMVNDSLDNTVRELDCPQKLIFTAMRYSLLAGGKRLRPVLALAVCEMLGGSADEVLPFACAIEMIHTYSLIHDDLPAMDNDDYRRGRLTNHKVYGDATAVLAGDALLNLAFETMLDACAKEHGNRDNRVRAAGLVSRAAGAMGMIGGQVVDLLSESRQITIDTLTYMHRCKTGALIKAPVMAAAALCGADGAQMSALERYAEKIGLAFQIKDDILDVEGSLEKMGKKTGSDAENNKTTFITVYGLEKSREILVRTIDEATACLGLFGGNALFLKELADYIMEREN